MTTQTTGAAQGNAHPKNCPRCGVALTPERMHGMNVEHCPECHGRWLDAGELTQLEATVEPDPNWRVGTIEWHEREDKLCCPVCGEDMDSFNYRDDAVVLDTCKEQHGFWLDSGETDEVLKDMKQRVSDLERSQKAEVKFGAFMYKMQHPSWLDRLNKFLKGS